MPAIRQLGTRAKTKATSQKITMLKTKMVLGLNDFSNTEPFYGLARRVYERDGREIINLTDGGALEIFEREDWRDW